MLDIVGRLLAKRTLGLADVTEELGARLTERTGTAAFARWDGPCAKPSIQHVQVRVPRGGGEGLVILTVTDRDDVAPDEAAVLQRFGEPAAVRPTPPEAPERRVSFLYAHAGGKLSFGFSATTRRARQVVIDRIAIPARNDGVALPPSKLKQLLYDCAGAEEIFDRLGGTGCLIREACADRDRIVALVARAERVIDERQAADERVCGPSTVDILSELLEEAGVLSRLGRRMAQESA